MPQKHYRLSRGDNISPFYIVVQCAAADGTTNRVATFDVGPSEGARALAAFVDGALRRGDTVTDYSGVVLRRQPDA